MGAMKNDEKYILLDFAKYLSFPEVQKEYQSC